MTLAELYHRWKTEARAEFMDRLRAERETRTLDDLATELGVTRQAIWEWLHPKD